MDFLEEMYSTYLLSAGPRWADGETATKRVLTFSDSPYEWVKKSGVRGRVCVGGWSCHRERQTWKESSFFSYAV